VTPPSPLLNQYNKQTPEVNSGVVFKNVTFKGNLNTAGKIPGGVLFHITEVNR
jgi:hypothetical protein